MREGGFCSPVQDLTLGQVVPTGLQGQACGPELPADVGNRICLSAVWVSVLQGLGEGHLLYATD